MRHVNADSLITLVVFAVTCERTSLVSLLDATVTSHGLAADFGSGEEPREMAPPTKPPVICSGDNSEASSSSNERFSPAVSGDACRAHSQAVHNSQQCSPDLFIEKILKSHAIN